MEKAEREMRRRGREGGTVLDADNKYRLLNFSRLYLQSKLAGQVLYGNPFSCLLIFAVIGTGL